MLKLQFEKDSCMVKFNIIFSVCTISKEFPCLSKILFFNSIYLPPFYKQIAKRALTGILFH